MISSCNKENIIEKPLVENKSDISTSVDEDFVTKNEASQVARLFFNKIEKGTLNEIASNEEKRIKSVETLFYDDGSTPAMYLINYDRGGFIIVSATKNYYPVLAYSDNSFLNLENFDKINDGLTIWKEEAKLAMKESKNLPEEIVSKIRNLWIKYEDEKKYNKKNTGAITLSYTYDQYMRFYQRMSELYTLCPGYSFGPLSSAQSRLSQSEYNNLVSQANFYGSPLECTIVGYKGRPVQQVGPLIGTEWDQWQPYNNLVPNQYPAGCVAIAMGQIMKFYGVPITYNWSNIPNNTGTYDTQMLIRDIGIKVDMDYGPNGSGATNNAAKNGFLSMGYSVIKKNHDYQDVKDELLIRQRPVYMTGDKENFIGLFSWKGHAWVCEGAKKEDLTVDYFVEYQLANGTYSSLGGPNYQSPISSFGYSYLYFYLNWGWGSNNGNGWFGFNDVNSQLGNYQYGRENLYVYPN